MLVENFWKESSFSEVFKVTIGKNFDEFDEEWLYALKKKYYPLLADHDTPSVVTWKITSEGFNSKPVVFEPDSTRSDVFFIGNRTGYTGIYKKNLKDPDPDQEEIQVIEGEQSDDFEAFHPFRSRIDVSRDGLLVFVTKSGENDVLHLYDVVEERVRETIRFRELVSIGSASWAPDGRKIALSSIDMSGNNDLYTFDLEERTLLRLTNDYYDDRDPAWSPDGKKIAFSSDRTPYGSRGVHNLFLYDLQTGAIEYLTYGKESSHSPSWSKDGAMIAFTSDAGGAQNIWVMEPEKRQQGGMRSMTKVTNFTTAAFDPTWTSTGDLLFATFEKFSFQIRRLDNVAESYDSSTTVRHVDLSMKEKPWRRNGLPGPPRSGHTNMKESTVLILPRVPFRRIPCSAQPVAPLWR